MTASESTTQRPSLLHASERLVASVVLVGTRLVSHPHVAAHTEKVSRELRQARAVGQFTVLTATAKLKAALAAETSETTTPPEDSPIVVVPDAPTCIPDYANLSASQIVPLLSALTEDERVDVANYESATRRRRTILAALGDTAS